MKKIFSALFLTLVSATAILAANETETILKNIPQTANSVFVVDYQKLENAPIIDEMKKMNPEFGMQADKFQKKLQELKLDVKISKIGIFAENFAAETPTGGIMVSGNITEQDLETILKNNVCGQTSDYTTTKISGKKVYLTNAVQNMNIPGAAPQKIEKIATCFLDKNLILIADESNIAGILNAKKGLDAELTRNLAGVDKNALVFGSFAIDNPQSANPQDIAGGIKNVAFSFALSGANTDAIDARIFLSATDENNATMLMNMCQQYLMLMSLSLGQKDQALATEMMSAVKISKKDKMVTMTVKLSEKLLKQLQSLTPPGIANSPATPSAPGMNGN